MSLLASLQSKPALSSSPCFYEVSRLLLPAVPSRRLASLDEPSFSLGEAIRA